MFDKSSEGATGGESAGRDVDAAPGKQPQPQTGGEDLHPTRAAKVDRALETLGSGEAHPTGARIHTDGTAAEAADAIGATAFTAGQDVFFGAGHYQPGTAEGDRIIGHELTHVAQAGDVTAPTPGNFSIASTTSHEETAARGASEPGHAPSVASSAMGPAAPATIFRDVDTTGTSLATALTPLMGAEGAQGFGATMGTAVNIGESGADKDKDKLQAFRYAVLSGTVADIEAKWKVLKVGDKHKLKDETDTLLKMMESWGPKAMHALPAIGVGVGKDPRFSQHIMWQANVADWKTQMSGTQWSQFIAADPRKENLDDKSRQGLAQAIKVAGSDANARGIFNKAFPTLSTDAKLAQNDWTKVKLAHWTTDRIARLFEIFANGTLPVGHILAATGGILLVSQQRTRAANTDPWGGWTNLGFAWWQPWNSVIVIPESSSGASGGGLGHDMVGGSDAKSTSPVGPLTHLQGSALHEIGHAVGDNIRGHTWASSGAAPAKWNQPSDAEVKNLWVGASNIEPGGTAKKLPEVDAKNVLHEYATVKTKTPPAGWTATDLDYALDTQYFKQPLYKLARTAQAGDNAYRGPIVHDAFAYAYLSRWDNKVGKYNEAAYNAKVSWYSVSSPNEWFAEQYVQYHVTHGAGTGMDPATVSYMKDLDKNTTATPGADPAAAPAAPAAPGGAVAATGERTTHVPGQKAPHRGEFPWAW